MRYISLTNYTSLTFNSILNILGFCAFVCGIYGKILRELLEILFGNSLWCVEHPQNSMELSKIAKHGLKKVGSTEVSGHCKGQTTLVDTPLRFRIRQHLHPHANLAVTPIQSVCLAHSLKIIIFSQMKHICPQQSGLGKLYSYSYS